MENLGYETFRYVSGCVQYLRYEMSVVIWMIWINTSSTIGQKIVEGFISIGQNLNFIHSSPNFNPN